MDGQITYIQSSSAPDAVRGCDKSLGGGTEWSRARKRGDEEDTTSRAHAEEKDCSSERDCVKCLRGALTASKIYPLSCPLGCCVAVWLTLLTDWLLHSKPPIIMRIITFQSYAG